MFIAIVRDICDFLGIVALITIPIFVLIAFLTVPIYFMDKKSCYDKTSDFESRHGLWTGCQVQVNGRWVDWHNFRVTDIEE